MIHKQRVWTLGLTAMMLFGWHGRVWAANPVISNERASQDSGTDSDGQYKANANGGRDDGGYAGSYVYELSWGGNGTINGKFSSLAGIAIDGQGNIWAGDERLQRIQKFDISGNYLGSFITTIETSATYDCPTHIAFDDAGYLYALCTAGFWIARYDNVGTEEYLGEIYYGAGSILTFAVDARNGDFYVAFVGLLAKVHDGAVAWSKSLSVQASETSVLVDSSGDVYINTYPGIQKYDSDGNFITEYEQLETSGQYPLEGHFGIDSSDKIYFLVTDSTGSSLVKVFDTDLNLLSQYSLSPDMSGSDQSRTRDFAVDSDGQNVYIAFNLAGNATNQIFKYQRADAPNAPTGVSASDGTYTDKVRVTWNSVTGATSYEVWRNTSDSSGSASNLSDATDTTYDDTSASPGITYYYWLKATNSVGTSDFSSSDSGWRSLSEGIVSGAINDFDGDGKTDLAIFDSNTGYWYVISAANSVIVWAQQWGWQGAVPVPGDYDNDGISDMAVFDSNTGYWYIQTVSGSMISWAVEWGWPGAVPVWGDYNADGVSDLAVFDSNTGYWYVYSLSGSVIAWAVEWGWPGAIPVSGDYNADGISDLAVFDSNTGYWYIYSLSGSVIAWAVEWGWPGAVPVSGDYDGDGLSDIAVFDSNTGYWYIKTISGSVIAWAIEWGWPGAVPVSGDYDGDGVSDLAVFDSNTGYWYIKTISGSVIAWAKEWGWPGAIPVGSLQ